MLLESRRCIDEFSQVELITDLAWDVDDSVWYFSINVHHNFAGRNIPRETVWYITVQDIFPYGKVKIFPSVIGGISVTFYHQSNNGLISENGLWREGDVCLKDPLESVADINSEPFEAIGRIKWNIIRLLEWIDKAENDNLVSEQDNFELPDVNELKNTQINSMKIVFLSCNGKMQEPNPEYLRCITKETVSILLIHFGMKREICAFRMFGADMLAKVTKILAKGFGS